MMLFSFKKISVMLLLGTALGLSACQKSSETMDQNADNSTDDQIMKELDADPVF